MGELEAHGEEADFEQVLEDLVAGLLAGPGVAGRRLHQEHAGELLLGERDTIKL